MHNGDLQSIALPDKYCQDLSKKGGWTRLVERGNTTKACRILISKTEGKRTLGRHGRIWEDNIKMDLQEME